MLRRLQSSCSDVANVCSTVGPRRQLRPVVFYPQRVAAASITLSSLHSSKRPLDVTSHTYVRCTSPFSVGSSLCRCQSSALRTSVRGYGNTTSLLAAQTSSSSPSPAPSSRRQTRLDKASRGKQRRSSRPAPSQGKRSAKHRTSRRKQEKPERLAASVEYDEEPAEMPPRDIDPSDNIAEDPSGDSGAAEHRERQQLPDTSTEPGWGLESIDATTGKTALEELYDRHLSKIHSILEQPLPSMPQDGSVDPDFFIGFASYSYQLRDQYRAVLARELQVPVKAVRLSVAWSGRFNVKRFGRVQKVCGVCLDRELLSQLYGSPRSDGELRKATVSPTDLPAELQQRIEALVAAVNGHQREDLLQVQMFQASPPIPEVEFALTRQEHRVVYHLHEWVRRHVLQRAVAVVVYGLPPPPTPPATSHVSTGGKAAQTKASAATDEASEAAAVQSEMQQHYERWQKRAVDASAAQLHEVQTQWLRLFHRREVVPSVISLTELATQAAAAVVRGEVTGVSCTAADEEQTKVEGKRRSDRVGQAGEEKKKEDVSATVVQLDSVMAEVLQRIAALTEANTASENASLSADDQKESTVRRDVLLSPARDTTSPILIPAGPEQQEAVLRWVRRVFQALLLRETHSAGAETASVPQEVTLPALFAQGVYAGSRDEVIYLQHNRAAMDALLLHPHEISFKKAFVSRMRNGHRRLTMEGEAAALRPDSR